ncbi:hypothetical protein REPUB_Repub07fG0150900 [Reevesia pubescens]
MDTKEIPESSEEGEGKIGAVDDKAKASTWKDGMGVALSPVSLIFHEPRTNCCIIAIIGCKTKYDPGIVKLGLKQTLINHPRFSSNLS